VKIWEAQLFRLLFLRQIVASEGEKEALEIAAC